MQLFQNLISNSIKFTPSDRKPVVEVAARREADSVVFSVKDNGIGIDPENHTSIFEIFRRIHRHEGEYEGTGIGLSTCKKIVERHRGDIWLESTPDVGTTFFIRMPVEEAVISEPIPYSASLTT